MRQVIISTDSSDKSMIIAADQSICRDCIVRHIKICRKARKNLGKRPGNSFTWVMQCSEFQIKK